MNKKNKIVFLLSTIILYLASMSMAHALTDVLIPNVTHVAYEATSDDYYEDPAFADVEFTSDQYDKVSVSDDNRESTTLSLDEWGDYGSIAQRFTFDLSKYMSGYKIINMTYYYEGYGTSDCSNVWKFPYIMYYSSLHDPIPEWTNDKALPTSESTKTKTFTSGFPDIILSNSFQFGVVMSYLTTTNCTMEIHTDFVKLEINYVPYQPEIITVCSSGCNATTVQGGVDLAWVWGEDTVLITDSGTYGTASIDKPLNLTSNSTTKPSTSSIAISSENVSVSNLIINGGISSQRGNTIIFNNEITGGIGLSRAGEKNAIITNNNITTSGPLGHGIRLLSSTGNRLSNNRIITTDAYSLYIEPPEPRNMQGYNHTIDTTNLANGKPIYYYFNNDSGTLENLDNVSQVYLTYCNNFTIKNLTINKDGITLAESNRTLISDTNISSSGYGVKGIWLPNNNYFNNITNTNITTSGELGHGIYLFSSHNNSISNVNITTSGYTDYGVYFETSNYNNITQTNISTSGQYAHGLSLHNSNYNNITSSRINASYSGVADIYLITLSTDNIFLDTIYTDESVDSGSKLKRLWYLDVYVNDTNGNPVGGASFSAWDKNNDLAFSELTASNGYITRKELIQYSQEGSTKTYYTNYIMNTTKIGHITDSREINIISSRSEVVTLNLVWLEVTLLIPDPSLYDDSYPYKVVQFNTFQINATVTCKDADCGTVQGILQYNASSSIPDTPIKSSQGDEPFYNTSGTIIQSCGSMSQGQFCQLNWTVNTTGNLYSGWKIDVKFSSSNTQVSPNDTDNLIIKIVPLNVHVEGIALYYYTGGRADGTVTVIPVEDYANKVTESFTNGQWSIDFYMETEDVQYLTFIIDDDENIGYNEFKLNNDVTASLTCSVQNISLSGYSVDLISGDTITSGNVRVSALDTDYTNTTSFTGTWSIDFHPCLIPGKIYTLQTLVSDNTGKRGEIFQKYPAR